MSDSLAVQSSVLWKWRQWPPQPAFWMPVADTFAVLTAVSLPWSTTLVSVFSACWIGSAALIVNYPAYFRSLKQPICAFPLALFALVLLGTLWSEASWSARLWSVGPAVKLLFLPGLFHHFQRSSRGMWVFAAFLASCAVLMMTSWIVWIDPQFKITATKNDGVPVKNYIDQTQELSLCLFAMLPLVQQLIRQRRHLLVSFYILLMTAAVADLAYVAFARTALLYIPVLLLLFAYRWLTLRQALWFLGAATAISVAIWWTSPFFRGRVGGLSSEYAQYRNDTPSASTVANSTVPSSPDSSSTGMRLEYWRKSLGFFEAAPIFGNGTGSTLQLFERASADQTGAAALVIRNPHNQTINVAVQWGIVGIALLWGMWISHFVLFRGEGFVRWIGFAIVAQNVLSSMANSHISDFHAGWMYVLGVGVAGGIVLRNDAAKRTGETVES